ncbi:hypothetical protein B0H12DRAFT_1243208 [Mycena haematopus]|nr:hypothetical protein B0H12DRAFT_1243208 [Mycena haematopus]
MTVINALVSAASPSRLISASASTLPVFATRRPTPNVDLNAQLPVPTHRTPHPTSFPTPSQRGTASHYSLAASKLPSSTTSLRLSTNARRLSSSFLVATSQRTRPSQRAGDG